MTKEIISTENAPAAVGPYSQGVRIGDLLFTAGQVALDKETGQLVGDDVSIQTDKVLRNLTAVLQAAGSSLENVVKTTVYLDNIDDFKAMNEVYGRFFTANQPARTTVEVARLPLGALVEIEAIAVIG
ncbi:MAG: RidA family protein [Candidatus Promineifilaceae bacterium]